MLHAYESTGLYTAHRESLDCMAQGKWEEAKLAMAGFLPVMGVHDFDFALYSLEHEILTRHLGEIENNVAVAVTEALDAARTASPEYYQDLLLWNRRMQDKISAVTGNADAFRELGWHEPLVPRRRSVVGGGGYQAQLLAEEYKYRFEIGHWLDFAANVSLVSAGHALSECPFACLEQDGRAVVDRNGHLVKGLAVRWLVEHAPSRRLGECVAHAYSSRIRNTLGGHNDYRFSEADCSYHRLDGSTICTLDELGALVTRLDSFQTFANVEANRRYFVECLPEMPTFGIMDFGWESVQGEIRRIVAYQCWACHKLRTSRGLPASVIFYPTPTAPREAGARISLCLGDAPFYPYDLRFIANERTLWFLRRLAEREMIEVVLHAVSPCPDTSGEEVLGQVEICSRRLALVGSLVCSARVVREPLLLAIARAEECLEV